jgi:hypothetical protein
VDGNIYVTGNSAHTTDKGQFTTIMYDSTGSEVWKEFYTGENENKANRGNKIIIDNEENIYAVGLISDKGGDVGIIKYNQDGMVWAESFTSSWFGDYPDEGLDIAADAEGNVYAIGVVTSTSGNLDDPYTIKVDADGYLVWEQQYSESSATDYPRAIDVTANGDVFSLTSTYNFWGTATFDITTIYYNTDGVQQWISRYNGEGDSDDEPTDVIVKDDKMHYVCGIALNESGNNDFVAMMQNEYGTRLWTVIYDGSANEGDTAYEIKYLQDSSAIITGTSWELIDGIGMQAATTVRVKADGTVAWTNTYTGIDSLGAAATTLAVDTLNGVYVAGYETTSDADKNGLLIKYNKEGEQEWIMTFDSEENLADEFRDVVLDNNLNIIATGNSFSGDETSRFLTVKYGQVFPADSVEDTTGTGGIDTTINTSLNEIEYNTLIIYPNPAGHYIHMNLPEANSSINEIIVTDATGRIVFSSIKPTSILNDRMTLNVTGLVAGVYLIKVLSDDKTYSGRFYKTE